MRVDPGFEVDRLVTVSFDPISSGYTGDQLPALAHRLADAAQTVPGVVASSASTCGLIAGCSSSGGFQIEGAEGEGDTLYRNWVSPGYFSTVGMRLVAGRDFTDRDTSRAPLIAVVNESIARRYFQGENPIGKRLGYSKPDVQIVGIVRDARTQTLHDLPVPMVYFPIDQKPIEPAADTDESRCPRGRVLRDGGTGASNGDSPRGTEPVAWRHRWDVAPTGARSHARAPGRDFSPLALAV